MRHEFRDLEGKKYALLTCDMCSGFDPKRTIARRSSGRDLCPQCWEFEQIVDAEAALHECPVCGNRRVTSYCPSCAALH